MQTITGEKSPAVASWAEARVFDGDLAEVIRELKAEPGKPIVSLGGAGFMQRQLRELNKKVTNAKQVRSSVITHWLKQHHLRQVQYMAGHKYVSSTERYQLSNIDDLKNAVQEHHPMK